jgi:hypothetical protein
VGDQQPRAAGLCEPLNRLDQQPPEKQRSRETPKKTDATTDEAPLDLCRWPHHRTEIIGFKPPELKTSFAGTSSSDAVDTSLHDETSGRFSRIGRRSASPDESIARSRRHCRLSATNRERFRAASG